MALKFSVQQYFGKTLCLNVISQQTFATAKYLYTEFVFVGSGDVVRRYLKRLRILNLQTTGTQSA
jgi:hypothetical protein